MDPIAEIQNYVRQHPLNNPGQGKTTAEVLGEIFSNVSYPVKGLQRMSIEDLDISMLDESHYMVYLKWKSTSLKDKTVHNLSVTYLLKEGADGFEVVSAITNNEQNLLRSKGYIE